MPAALVRTPPTPPCAAAAFSSLAVARELAACLTEAFARQGSLVAFVDYAEAPSQALVQQIEKAGLPRPWYRKTDVTDINALQAAIRDAATALGDFHVLINNVASDDRHSLMEVTPEYYDARIAVNQRPAFFAIQAVVPGMKKMGGGSIINFGSNSYGAKGRNMPVYTTAKSSVIGLTRGLAAELGEHRIRVNVITPGWIMTERQIDEVARRPKASSRSSATRCCPTRCGRKTWRPWRCSSPPTIRAPARRRNTSSTRVGYEAAAIHRWRPHTRRARRRRRRRAAAVALREHLAAGAQRASPRNARSNRWSAPQRSDAPLAYADLLRDGRLLPPLTHPDPAHCLVSGTGLTHLGSAAARDAMHAKLDEHDDELTDSMKMFKWGVEGGKPEGQQARHAARVVLQGQWTQRRGLRLAAHVARLRRGPRRGARARRPLHHR